MAKTGSFYEHPDSIWAISARNRPPWALFLEHHIKTRLNKVWGSCVCKDIYRSMLWGVGKITSVPAVESFPGWWLFWDGEMGKLWVKLPYRCIQNSIGAVTVEKTWFGKCVLMWGTGCLQPGEDSEEKLWSLEREKPEGKKAFWWETPGTDPLFHLNATLTINRIGMLSNSIHFLVNKNVRGWGTGIGRGGFRWESSVDRGGFQWDICILKLFCPMGHSEPFIVGNEKCSKGGGNHLAKPRGDVLREDLKIMPWTEVSQVVVQPVPGALFFTLIPMYVNQDMIPNGQHKGWQLISLHKRQGGGNPRESREFFQPGCHKNRERDGLCCHGIRVWWEGWNTPAFAQELP